MINKLKAIFCIIFAKYGVIIFEKEPADGDTITVGRMIATFHRK